MKFPVSVKYTTYLAYKQDENLEPRRKIKSEVLDWDSNIPKSLVSLCTEKLAENWMGQCYKFVLLSTRLKAETY